jgi:hypothetical protein
MDINKVTFDFNEKKIQFHKKIETDLFADVLENYRCEKYVSCATLGMVLFESILTTKLIRLTAYPKDFLPSKKNVSKQFELILKREEEIINGNNSVKQRGLSFKQITAELAQKIMSDDEKKQLDEFYDQYRIPILHGLTHRLYELLYNKKPVTFLDSDLKSDEIYKIVSEKVINKIYDLYVNKKILKD